MRSTTSEEIGRRLARSELLFSQSDAKRYPKPKTPEALAFQVTQAALEMWPSDVKVTDIDIAVIDGCARDTALTIHLNELANF